MVTQFSYATGIKGKKYGQHTYGHEFKNIHPIGLDMACWITVSEIKLGLIFNLMLISLLTIDDIDQPEQINKLLHFNI